MEDYKIREAFWKLAQNKDSKVKFLSESELKVNHPLYKGSVRCTTHQSYGKDQCIITNYKVTFYILDIEKKFEFESPYSYTSPKDYEQIKEKIKEYKKEVMYNLQEEKKKSFEKLMSL